MESSTKILRRLLDERGVEYVVDEEYGKKYPPEKRVTWSCDLAGEDMTVTARDYCISIDDDGSADYFLDLDFHEVFTPEQAIAATLGTGTCELVNAAEDLGDGTSSCMCDKCGYTALDDWWDVFNYCPNCGRRIVEPTTNDADAEVDE